MFVQTQVSRYATNIQYTTRDSKLITIFKIHVQFIRKQNLLSISKCKFGQTSFVSGIRYENPYATIIINRTIFHIQLIHKLFVCLF